MLLVEVQHFDKYINVAQITEVEIHGFHISASTATNRHVVTPTIPEAKLKETLTQFIGMLATEGHGVLVYDDERAEFVHQP